MDQRSLQGTFEDFATARSTEVRQGQKAYTGASAKIGSGDTTDYPVFKLSPSTFAFLWTECRHCFYLDVVLGLKRPRAPFPAIFTKIDKLMRQFYAGKPTSEISPSLPPGSVDTTELTVRSQVIRLPGRRVQLVISGKLDATLKIPEENGVIDFKTSAINKANIDRYGRQLRAYAYCLENAQEGRPALIPVEHLGLLVYEPNDFLRSPVPDTMALSGVVSYTPIPRDKESFLKFLDQVAAVLELPSPPEPSPNCSYCQYASRI